MLCCRKDGARCTRRPTGRIERIRSSYALHRLLYLPYPCRRLVRSSVRSGGSSPADVVHVQDALYGSSVAALAAGEAPADAERPDAHVAFVPQHNVVLDAAQHVAIATLGRAHAWRRR